MKLYEVGDEIERILAQEVDQETGEITDETLAKLDALEMERDEIILFIARYIKGERAEGGAITAEAKRLLARGQSHLNRAESLCRYIDRFMPKEHVVKDPTAVVSYRTSQAVVLSVPEVTTELTSEDLTRFVDPDYLRVKQWIEVDKKKATPVLKSGTEIKGLKLETRQKLQIK